MKASTLIALLAEYINQNGDIVVPGDVIESIEACMGNNLIEMPEHLVANNEKLIRQAYTEGTNYRLLAIDADLQHNPYNSEATPDLAKSWEEGFLSTIHGASEA